MGSAASTITDERIQRTSALLNLTKKDISGFWSVFRKFDYDLKGSIPLDVFFRDCCKEERTLFGDAIFDLIDTEDTSVIEFGEFVMGVCTFAMFETKDILRFSFYIFDKDKSGTIDRDELDLFIATLHSAGVQGNIVQALKNVDYNTDGKIDFEELCEIHEKYPTVLFPAFRLQTQMTLNIMGAGWWDRKKSEMYSKAETDEAKLIKEKRKMFKKLMKERKRNIREQMGFTSYLLGGKRLDYYQRMNPPPHVYIDETKVIRVDTTEAKHLPNDEQFRNATEERKHKKMLMAKRQASKTSIQRGESDVSATTSGSGGDGAVKQKSMAKMGSSAAMLKKGGSAKVMPQGSKL